MEGYYECKDVPKRKLIFAEVTTNCCEVWFQEASRRHSFEAHSENVVFVIEKTSFGEYFEHLKCGVRDTIFSEPIYQ